MLKLRRDKTAWRAAVELMHRNPLMMEVLDLLVTKLIKLSGKTNFAVAPDLAIAVPLQTD